MNPGFLDKLVDRLDKLDPKSLQTQFLRLAKERGLLETIFQSVQEGLVVIDGTGRINYANRAAEQMLGFVFEQAKGRPVANYLRDIEWDRILSLDAGEWSRLIAQELEITYPEHRFVSFYVVPLASGKRIGEDGALIMLRDVTRDRIAENTMIESERLNAVKLLAAGVAHEIGNPLNALNIHLQLLERELNSLPEGDKAPLKELVGVARGEVGRLDVIITQFLRALRPAKPELVPTDMEALVKETLSLLRQEIEDRSIAVELHSASALPRIHVDPSQMKQAFFNIIRNAVQAMPNSGSLHVNLSCNDRYLAVVFRDSGGGIPAADLGRVFEPYFTTKARGSGLGLMIVQRIVQDHGGLIEIASRPDRGTVFSILLPLDERRVRLLAAPRSAPEPAKRTGFNSRKGRPQ
jgi:PAS domain S-box-containing protein